MCVTGQLQHTRHLVLHKVDPEPQLDSQEGKVNVFFIILCTFCSLNLHLRFLQLTCLR